MSFEDDSGPSLKELVTKNLEVNGILGKIQAQLRASVFLTLEEEMKQKDVPLINKKAQELLSTQIGKLATNIIQDFLHCLKLEFTLAVFNPESNALSSDILENRKFLLTLGQSEQHRIDDNYPVLFRLLEESQIFKNLGNDSSTILKTNNCLKDETLSSGKPLSVSEIIPSDKKINNGDEESNSLHHLTSEHVEKNKSSSIENQYDEEFSSLSDSKKNSDEESLMKHDKNNIKTNINLSSNKSEENVGTDDFTEDDVPEEIDEDISEDQCDNSRASNETKDNTTSQIDPICDYQESL